MVFVVCATGRSAIWCTDEGLLQRQEKVNWFSAGTLYALPPLELCRISSRDLSEVVMLPPSSLDSPAQACWGPPPWLTVVLFPSQAKYWSMGANEVQGVITDKKGNVIHKLFGKWHEAVYCGEPPTATCVWRASTTGFFINPSVKSLYGVMMGFFWSVCLCLADPMPVDHEQYFGFSKFAIELNELDPSLEPLLPPTDTRLRPDQR